MLLQLLLGFVLLVGVILLTLLLLPFYIRIDSLTDEYYVAWQGIFRCALVYEDDKILFQVNAPFYRKTIDPFASGSRPTPKKIQEKDDKPEQSKKSKSRITPKKILAMLQSTKVHVFALTLDTGDYVKNALLVPVFQVLNRTRGNFSVSFQGNSSVQVHVSNTLWRLGMAYLKN